MNAKVQYRSERIDHLGIVSGIYQEIGLVAQIAACACPHHQIETRFQQ